MRVRNMESNRGNLVANQFLIEDYDKDGNYVEYFQSYRSIIVKTTKGITYLDKNYWDYSVTTGKYRNIYLGESKKETEKKIQSGEYKLENLN